MFEIITVYKDGREMPANSNPQGLAELAKSGWSTTSPKSSKPQKLRAK
jgi:hypothetical protein